MSRPDWVYLPTCFGVAEADAWLARLLSEIEWRQEQATMFGRAVPLPRLVAWHGDAQAHYRYSGISHAPQPWTASLLALREKAEALAGVPFNSVLLNLYRDGGDSIGWHSDDERELGPEPTVASLSFGAARRFQLKSRLPDHPARHEITLAHGSALIMPAGFQARWRHAIPKERHVEGARVNLTFRRILPL